MTNVDAGVEATTSSGDMSPPAASIAPTASDDAPPTAPPVDKATSLDDKAHPTAPAPPEPPAPSRPEHRVFFHWLPWALPLLAIALPEIILIVIGTATAQHMTTDLAAKSVNRGELLIPVIIICGEAFRRWWETKINNPFAAALAAFFAVSSAFLAFIAIAAYAVVLANPQTRGFSDIADTFTWGPLACGLIAGTIAIGQTAPRKTGKR